VGIDDDCDGVADDPSAADAQTWYPDTDEDGFGDASHPGETTCTPTAGWVTDAADCDDEAPGVHPGAEELPADGIDADCDEVDTCWVDGDGDGHPGTVEVGTTLDCTGVGEYLEGPDCDDGDEAVHPGARETVADGIDQDCDGGDDCWRDSDGDGHGDEQIKSLDLACDAASEASVAGDCNDLERAIHPGAAEGVGDGTDQDCDGRERCHLDGDHDGHGGPELANVEDIPCSELGHAPTHTDCDDGDEAVHPDGDELPGDGVDSDCDGIERCHQDLDGDGFGTPTLVDSIDDTACTGSGEAEHDGDCNDFDELAHPGATELPGDGVDSDCDEQEDCFRDGDHDGRGSPYLVASDDLDCEDAGEAPRDDDCDDGEPLAWTGAAEVCDGVDNDCDGEGDGLGVWYVDSDGDGFGEPGSQTQTCEPKATQVSNGDDCNDRQATVYPGARETPNDRVDQDCDGEDKKIIAVGACSTVYRPIPTGLLALVAAFLPLARRRSAPKQSINPSSPNCSTFRQDHRHTGRSGQRCRCDPRCPPAS
jgi:hypothetical protein